MRADHAKPGGHRQRRTGKPAVLLLDIKMPKIDGLEVLRQIRTSPELHCLPVVMLTSSREEGDLLRSYELGATLMSSSRWISTPSSTR
jgi:CheY-like chemotaxis protein